ncbi:MAG: hypothetical protein FWG64_02985 [Firmicutes bacterium]|nr:hypothetical protein [Bacillota bacterium]
MKYRNQKTGLTFDIPNDWNILDDYGLISNAGKVSQFTEVPAEILAFFANTKYMNKITYMPEISITVNQELAFYPTKAQFNQRFEQIKELYSLTFGVKFGSIDGGLFGNKQGCWFLLDGQQWWYKGFKHIRERLLDFTLTGCSRGKVPKDVKNDFVKIVESVE